MMNVAVLANIKWLHHQYDDVSEVSKSVVCHFGQQQVSISDSIALVNPSTKHQLLLTPHKIQGLLYYPVPCVKTGTTTMDTYITTVVYY